jgi:hypothetical protein
LSLDRGPLGKERIVCLLVEISLVALALQLCLTDYFLVNLQQVLILQNFCEHGSLFVDQVSMGEREVVYTIKAVHSDLFVVPLLLLFLKDPIRDIKCFSLEVPVDCMALELLE